MATWRVRFSEMVRDLEAHPRLRLEAGTVRAGCSDDDLSLDEDSYGLTVSAEIRAFYTDMNGAEIVWTERPALARDPARFPELSGRITIPSFQRLVNDWEDFLWLDEEGDAGDEDEPYAGKCAHLRPFNFYEPNQADKEAMCLSLEGRHLHADRGLVHAGTRWGDVPFLWHGRSVGLTDYLELLLATRGRRTWHDGPETLESLGEPFPDARLVLAKSPL